MVTQELIEFVKKSIAAGSSPDQIHNALLGQGWSENDIAEGLARANPPPPAFSPPPSPSSPATAWTPQNEPAGAHGEYQPQEKKRAVRVIILGLVIFGILGGGAALAYKFDLLALLGISKNVAGGPLSKVFEKIGDIDSASYSMIFSIESQPRDIGAKPYVPSPEDEAAQRPYDRDKARFDDLAVIKTDLESKRKNSGVYPGTLLAGGISERDPQGKPYGYRTTQNGTDVELVITFETGDAIKTIQSSSSNRKPAINGKMVTFTSNSLKNYYYFRGKPARPAFIELASEENFLSFLPGNLNIVLKASGSAQKESTDTTDARIQLGADINFEDFIINADAEFLKTGLTYFAKVNKFPGLFFDISKIKQKWIRVTPEDIISSGADLSDFDIVNTFLAPPTTGRQKNNIKPLEQFQLFFQLAESEGAFSAEKPKLEKLNNSQAYHYILKLHPEKIAPFYKRFTEEAKKRFGTEAFMQFDEAMVQYLESREFKTAFEYVSANTSIETWVDAKNGFPTKVQYGFRFVPSAQVKKLRDKQFYATASLTLADINKEIPIEEPKDFMTFEDAVTALTGISKEEYAFGRQTDTVRALKRAIDEFKTLAGKYPASLDELTKTRKEIRALNPSQNSDTLDTSYFDTYETRPLIKVIPVDSYTHKPYSYARNGSDYALIYTITLPPYEKGTILSYSLTDRVYGTGASRPEATTSLRYVDGKNTATSKTLSEEALRAAKIDSDGDRLPDNLETYIGSNRSKKDTDGDGVDDGTELKRGTDPLGVGRLKYAGGSDFIF